MIYTVNYLKKVSVESDINFDGLDDDNTPDLKPIIAKIKYFKIVFAPVWSDKLLVKFLLKEHENDINFEEEYKKATKYLDEQVYYKKTM